MATKPVKTTAPLKGAGVTKDVKADSGEFAFGKINFRLLLISIGLLLLGFILMSGGKSDTPAVFNEDVFSFRRITLAPMIVMIGYAVGVYAIVKKAD